MKIIKFTTFLLVAIQAFCVSADVRYQLFLDLPGGAQLKKLDDIKFDELTPNSSGVITDFTLNETGNFFAYRYSAEFNAATSDVYHFYLASDDGARLYIDDKLVIDNDGLQAVNNTLSNSVFLSQGAHYIKLEYFEKWGAQTLSLSYQTGSGLISDPNLRLPVGPDSQAGDDFDADGLMDYYDTLHFANCDLSKLSDSRYTDYRNCDFTNMTFPVGQEPINKNFDGAIFSRTNFNYATFENSSFRGADFTPQYEVMDSDGFPMWPQGSFFGNSDFTGATVEKHWPNATFYNVDFSAVYFTTEDSSNWDSSWYCYINGNFSALDLVRYDLPAGIIFNDQSYFLGIVGQDRWETGSFTGHACVSDINISDGVTSFLVGRGYDIAPHIFMMDGLARNYSTTYGVDFWVTGISTNTGNDDTHINPVYGDNTRPAFRSGSAHTSPYWEWDLGAYYKIKSLRLKQNPALKSELEDATLMVSDWPFTGNPLLFSDFDSIARYNLGKSATGDYRIPVNRSVRYIRLQRPKSASGQYLSFDKLELVGDATQGITPLAGATTPLPNDFVLPAHETGRSECSGFNPDLLDPDFDVALVTPDEYGDETWSYANLSQQNYNQYDFTRAYAEETSFEQTQLVGANFQGVRANNANFRGANLEGANFSGAYIGNADFRGANLKDTNFNGVSADCAYFSGSLPNTYSPIDEFVGFPQITTLAADAAYGYTRASSIDEGTRTDMAIDKDSSTTSVTALEKTAWWELDMGAIYALRDIVLLTGMSMQQDELLQVFASDWPIPYELDSAQLPPFVRLIDSFTVDQDRILFHGNQTGRYIRVMVPASLGPLKLRLTEVEAQSPAIPTAPTTNLPLTPGQVSDLVPQSQALIEQIDRLIELYGIGDSDYEGVRKSVNQLFVLNEGAIDDSYNIEKIGRNIRTMLRPISSSKLLLKSVQIIPPFKEPIQSVRDVLGALEKPAKGITLVTKTLEFLFDEQRKNLLHTRTKLNGLNKEINSQISLLIRGRNYLASKQRCAIYGTESADVLPALESYSVNVKAVLQDTIDQITVGEVMKNATDFRRQQIQKLVDDYNRPSTLSSLQDSEAIVEAMGPFAAAITPVQLFFSKGKIYKGYTVWDILELVTGFTDSVTNAIYKVPFIGDLLTFVTDFLRPPIDEIVNIAIKPLTEALQGALGDSLNNMASKLEASGEQSSSLFIFSADTRNYVVPAVNTTIFSELFTLSSDSAFASCNDSLNLPPQWPAAEGDDDGDGLLNAFELETSFTLTDNPDSDLDGLGDWFEVKWNDQAPDEMSKFQANNAIAGEVQRDSDNDGLDAQAEFALNTNPFDADTDNDGLTDGQEVLYGTDPLSAIGGPPDLDLDIDGDGLSIAEELALGLDPLDPNDVSEDPDADGKSIAVEIALGFKPFVAAPQALVSNLLLAASGDQATIIDTRQFYSYSSTEASVVSTLLYASEGSIEPDSVNNHLLVLKPAAGIAAHRKIKATFKITSPGGDRMIYLEINKAAANDVFPFDLTETSDNDGDGIGDNADPDDDNDGVADTIDVFPFDATETVDNDSDGIGDNADPDDDNDGVADTEDAFPLDAAESVDTDQDGVGNNADSDDDNDGVLDNIDLFPLDAAESVDTDQDGVGNNADSDDDNDGVLDNIDLFPLDATESLDTDADGIGDNADLFPTDATETSDHDEDGYGDNIDTDDDNDGLPDWLENLLGLDSMNDLDAGFDLDADAYNNLVEYIFGSDLDDINSIPLFSLLEDDSDGDAIPDSVDLFPLDATEFADSDGDGIGNNIDDDDDADTVNDSLDAFPLDSTESVDTDSDGVGDNVDVFPNDDTETLDTDGDGIGNNADTDDDGDGVNDSQDTFPLDNTETLDTDGDGVGDNADVFPNDSTEELDTDADGVGNNAEMDDDGDAVSDALDNCPLTANAPQTDSDGDGTGDACEDGETNTQSTTSGGSGFLGSSDPALLLVFGLLVGFRRISRWNHHKSRLIV